ncbi:MAG: methyltransferase [Candidatus Paceibacterota bacterium]|jgi:methylase of polypeptide subunit release factors
MKFKDFNNIDIENAVGVSPTGGDTKLLAQEASKIHFNSAVEIGTGNGFVPIYLKTLGYSCDGTDINPLAVECAKKNADRNNAKNSFYVSNLFEQVRGTYDLILFNPPFGNAGTSSNAKYLEIIKSLIPKENIIIAKLAFFFIKKQRAQLVVEFLKKVEPFLNGNGKILIWLHESEIPLAGTFKIKIVGDLGKLDVHLVLLEKK